MNDTIRVRGPWRINGTVAVPGDKSISHRSVLFNSVASGKAELTGLLDADDIAATRACMQELGVEISATTVHGGGFRLRRPERNLYCGNSGTTARLLTGLLAGQDFHTRLVGDESLSARPMKRVTAPLSEMGARFSMEDGHLPLDIYGASLNNQEVIMGVASAQVKTALLLAGLQGVGRLEIVEPYPSRNHSENLLRTMGVDLEDDLLPDGRHRLALRGGQSLQPADVSIPGDISSAAFLIVAACICPDSDLTICDVGLNPTRTGLLDVLLRMGADISIEDQWTSGGETIGDIRVRSSELIGTTVSGAEIPRLIDELPVLGVAAAHATGVTTVSDAAELRVKETDRCASTVSLCRSMGAIAEEQVDGFTIQGNGPGSLSSFGIAADLDHRTAMAGVIAGIASSGETVVTGAHSIKTSFPTFMEVLEAARGS